MRFGDAFGGLIPGPRGAVLDVVLTGAPMTGRQVHALIQDQFSLWSVQQAISSLAALRETIRAAVGSPVNASILSGSVARGEATADSDLDLAVLAPPNLDGRVALEDHVRGHSGPLHRPSPQ